MNRPSPAAPLSSDAQAMLADIRSGYPILSPDAETFLLNAFDMVDDEITASSLIKIDIAGKVLWEPEFPPGLGYRFNPAGWVIHAAIHDALPQVHGVVHTHSLATMAVSSLARGLLPMTQTAMRLDRITYHDYEGVVVELAERERLVRILGDCDVMFLRNHGVLKWPAMRRLADRLDPSYRE